MNPDSRLSGGADTWGTSVPSYLIVFFGALVALGPLSMDAYLPAIPAMALDFGVSVVVVNHTLSVYLIGNAIGQLFGGAFSDQIGRKRIGYIGLAIYIATTIAIAFVGTVEQALVLRFFQAVGGGFSTVICLASVRDIYPVEELGRRFAAMMMIVLVAPLVAPAIGTLMLPLGWQSIFLLKAAYSVFLLVLYAAVVPETREGHWRAFSLTSVFSQCAEVAVRRVDGRLLPLRYAFGIGLSISVLMIFVTNASFVYLEHFDIGPTMFPAVFGLTVLGLMSTNLFSMRRLTSSNAGFYFRVGMRTQIVATMLMLALAVAGLVSIWVFVPLMVVMMGTLGLIGPSGSARYMSFFRELAGSASSVQTTLSFALGGVLGAVTSELNDGTLLPMVAVMALASIVANLVTWSVPTSPVKRTEPASRPG